MAQASRKVIAPDADELTLATPRFDEAAAQQARPVVPLSGNLGFARASNTAVRGADPSYLPAGKGSWLIAALLGLVLGAGAMAVGVVAYRRDHTTAPSAQPLVPAAAAVLPELNQDFRPRPSASRSVAPAQPTVAVESKPEVADNGPAAAPAPVAVAPAPKRVKRRSAITSAPSEVVSSENSDSGQDSSGRPKPRLVDRYIMRSPRP
jgi:hypothetical protein